MGRKSVVYLDALFSKFIRLYFADDRGFCKCFTCENILHWKNIQAGHYIVRGNMSTRYEFNNMRPQCKMCNEVKGGMQEVFKDKLIMQVGFDTVKEIELKGREVMSFNDLDIHETYEWIKEEVKKMEYEKR